MFLLFLCLYDHIAKLLLSALISVPVSGGTHVQRGRWADGKELSVESFRKIIGRKKTVSPALESGDMGKHEVDGAGYKKITYNLGRKPGWFRNYPSEPQGLATG